MKGAYLVTGPSGSGKSTLGCWLAERGFAVVEADHEPGLSAWVNEQGAPVVAPPQPFPADWLAEHRWVWSEHRLVELLSGRPRPVFVCGGAHNEISLYRHFERVFALHVPTSVMVARLKAREPRRWPDDSPELQRMCRWNDVWVEHAASEGSTILSATQPVERLGRQLLASVGLG